MFCPYCHAKGVDNLSLCLKCGKSLLNVKKESNLTCGICNSYNPDDAIYCWYCGGLFKKPPKRSVTDSEPSVSSYVRSSAADYQHFNLTNKPATPVLSFIFYVLGALEIIGGFILCVKLWPNPAELDYGYEYKAVAYVPALTWLFVGLISGFLFVALGEVLRYLKRIWRSIGYFTISRQG